MVFFMVWSFWDLLQWSLVLMAFGISILLILIASLMISQNTAVSKVRKMGSPTHLLIVLGSGGHTAEMFYMLDQMKLDINLFTYRTYVVSSGDNFSAGKAKEYEAQHVQSEHRDYTVLTVPRARKVHQSYLTAPLSTLSCFWACLNVLRGLHPDQRLPSDLTSPHPDLILTNGPATAVCVIVAAKLIRFFLSLGKVGSWLRNQQSVPSVSKLRTIYVESWARVGTLSMSGALLLPFADRFLVQWPAQAGRRAWWGMKKTQYAGWLVM